MGKLCPRWSVAEERKISALNVSLYLQFYLVETVIARRKQYDEQIL